MTLTVEASPVVLRDVFPAEVTAPDGTLHRKVRAVLSRERLYVFAEVDGAPAAVVSEPWVEEGSTVGAAWSRRPFTVATEEGRWIVNHGYGCGCSSPLRAARLFTGAGRTG